MGYAVESLAVTTFVAKISHDNVQSNNLFRALGFSERSKSEVFRETTFLCAPNEDKEVSKAIEEVWNAARRGTYDET
jgi:RimJ/RimL family protein N-acetyltransferase